MSESPDDLTDTDRLVELIAAADRSFPEIADELGLPVHFVKQAARGQTEAAIRASIQAATQGYLEEARRLVAKWARALVTRHIRIAMNPEESEPARKCREYLITTFIKPGVTKDSPPPAAAHPAEGKRLTREEMARWAKDNGGPES